MVLERHACDAAVAPTLTVRLPAVAASVPRARHAVADWARREGAGSPTVDAAGLAVTEAVTNAVRHAYPGAPGNVEVEAARDGSALAVSVRDWGVGRAAADARTAGAGFGLLLVAEMCTRFETSSPPDGGTLVRMCFSLAEDGGQSSS
jgi:serine/threonine-protein kinase RsbW